MIPWVACWSKYEKYQILEFYIELWPISGGTVSMTGSSWTLDTEGSAMEERDWWERVREVKVYDKEYLQWTFWNNKMEWFAYCNRNNYKNLSSC
jgi:hypothetical protein